VADDQLTLIEDSQEPVALTVAGAYSIKDLVYLANVLAGTKQRQGALTLPKALQGSPPDTLAVMLAGRELGIGPMQSTRQIHIITGQTALATELKLTMARRAGHDIRPMVREPARVIVKCVTHDSHPVEWALTREDSDDPGAVIAGQIQQGGKSLITKENWLNYPQQMLWARAVAQLCREHCPEAVGGMYSVEELSAETPPKEPDK
jgi:hypothetical protein